MASRQLTDAECGQTNPLLQLTSHVTHDHVFSDTQGDVFANRSDQLVEQFLQETRAMPQTFRMDDLMREMHEIESQKSALPPVPASAIKEQLQDNSWAEQYIEDGRMFHDNTSAAEDIWAEIKSQEEQNLHNEIHSRWVTDYSSLDTNEIQESARELTENVDDPKFVYSKFMNFMQQVGSGELDTQSGRLTEQEAQSWTDEYLKAAAQQDETLSQTWLDSFKEAHSFKDKGFNQEYWKKLQEEMKKVSNLDDGTDHPWLSDFTDYLDSKKDYEFSEDNPMFDINNPLERGKQFLEEGDLPSAVLCFEAAVKKEPENTEAWLYLGRTQAENEQDPNAIPALRKCLKLDPGNLKALMSLAISYTNETYYKQANQTLVTWLRNNPKYAELVPPDFKLSGDEHRAVQELFIKAAQRQPVNIDYEVQCGLGVLFNLSSEYDKAADCFRAALSVKPDDARLWNRLGATLANGTRAEEAVDAYHHALQLSPGFIRARYNVGITCINLGAYREAAEHFLTALNQQARGKDVMNAGTMSQMSNTIWSTLRMCIGLMNRADLRPAVDSRDLATLNKEFNIVESQG